MKNFLVTNVKEKYNEKGVFEGIVSVYDNEAQETFIENEDGFFENVTIESAENSLFAVYNFTYDKNNDKLVIDDYGEIRDEFYKEEKEGIQKSIRDSVERTAAEKSPIVAKIEMSTYGQVLELASCIINDLKDTVRNDINLNLANIHDHKITCEEISYLVLDAIENNMDIIKAAMLPDYDLTDAEDIEMLKQDLNEMITELSEKITNVLYYGLNRNEHIRFESESIGTVDLFSTADKTMLTYYDSDIGGEGQQVVRVWDDTDIHSHAKDFIKEIFVDDVITNGKAIMLFEFKQGLTNIQDARPTILIENEWSKINAIINEDKAFTIANIEEISLPDFMEQYFDTYYDVNYRGEKGSDFKHIGQSNVNLRNDLYYVVSEGNSQYLKDTFDLLKKEDLQKAVAKGFAPSDVKKNMNKAEQYVMRDEIEELYADYQAELDKVNLERGDSAYRNVHDYMNEDIEEDKPVEDVAI